MEKINYQLKMEEQMKKIPKDVHPKLLLHCCCAPCSSAVLERLSDTFDITLYFANPNITSEEEYQKRSLELTHLLDENHLSHISIVVEPFENESFFQMSKGLEQEKERGKRCYLCYQLRLKKTCAYAIEHHFDYFTTTLSISPYKNASWINQIGESLNQEKTIYLYADFKKVINDLLNYLINTVYIVKIIVVVFIP